MGRKMAMGITSGTMEASTKETFMKDFLMAKAHTTTQTSRKHMLVNLKEDK